MISVIQAVTEAKVVVDHRTTGAIDAGILALIGIEKTDTEVQAEKLLDKILHYRIFPDIAGKTNLSLLDIKGGLLLVPQFTLVAETHKGTRPGFSTSMPPQAASVLFESLVSIAKQKYEHIAQGSFGDHMQVHLCNNGPMTFILRT